MIHANDTDSNLQDDTSLATGFAAAVRTVTAQARLALPGIDDRIDRAMQLALDGHVTLTATGATVRSTSDPERTYEVNGSCPCDAMKYQASDGPAYYCAHRIAYGIAKRAGAIMQRQEDAAPGAQEQSSPGPSGIPAQFLVTLHGKQFVLYAGLLALAHERGLLSLKATFISVTDTLALAEATATLADGRSVTEAADATPQNVSAKVAAHFPRMALTRAKARALRDLLNISVTSFEELSD